MAKLAGQRQPTKNGREGPPRRDQVIAFFAWQSDKAGTDSGQLKISAKPEQSQQYAKIDFQIDAYISGSRRPPALSSLHTPTETGGSDENGNDDNDGPSRGRGRLRWFRQWRRHGCGAGALYGRARQCERHL